MNRYFKYLISSLLALISLISSETSAQSLTFWGTRHAVFSGEPNNTCERQQDLLFSAIQKNPKDFPNLIFGLENVKPAEKSEKLLAIEDEVLRDYAGLYVIARSLVEQINTDIQSEQLTPVPQYGELIANYFRYIGDRYVHPNMAPFGVSKFITEAEKPYFKRIEGDLAIARPGIPTQKIVTPELVERSVGLLNAAYEGSLSSLPGIMDSYVLLSLKIAQEYYGQKLLADKIKYNVEVDSSVSSFTGKNTLDIKEIQPTYLFDKKNLLSKSHSEKVDNLFRFWRNHFIVANSINLMKKNPNKDILVWLGVNHISGVKNMISKTSLLTKEQKSRVKYLTPDSDPNVACSYTSVLSAIKDSRR